ncbi:nucleotidyltransferase domain-containing protein [Sphingomonas bacterium]|uniref:nucleotidyltransferase domain-containing protein n=1 Tax=Sphingomonas bacterium TaxID=1895847 RepID=UPI001576D4DA|nr:nucleotidyltransferase domain-containing protein [Sphingomonas bacterium]
MRLEQCEVAAIKAVATDVFGSDVIVRLFGSRARDDLKGGDIDLHFEVNEGQQDVRHAAAFRWRLYDAIDEQKMDLVFAVRGRKERPIDRIAREEGVIL